MADDALLNLAAEIVASHVSNNNVPVSDLPSLIQNVYSALRALGTPVAIPETELKPAVAIRASVKPDHIACLECGQKMKMLRRHLGANHDLTPAQYRTRWNLTPDYPLVAPNYAAQRRALALKIGLGGKTRSGNIGKGKRNDSEGPLSTEV